MTKMFRPKIPEPKIAAAPPSSPNMTETPRQELGGDSETNHNTRRRKGRNALRIDPQMGAAGVSAGRTGLNIPMK